MSLHFYDKGEDIEKEESIDHYKDLFIEYVKKSPTLKEGLEQIFTSGGVPQNEVNEFIDDLINKAKK